MNVFTGIRGRVCQAVVRAASFALVVLAVSSNPLRSLAAEPTGEAFLQIELGTHSAAIRRLAVDASRNLVVTGSDDKTVRAWALDRGQLQRILRPPVGPGEVGRVYGVALHPTLPWVAIAGTSGSSGFNGPGQWIYLFDVQSGKMIRRFDARAGDVKRLLWSEDGSLLFAGYAGAHGLRAFDSQGGQVFADSFNDGVYALATRRDQLAAAGLDGTLRLYAVGGATASTPVKFASQVKLSRNPVSLSYSSDLKSLAIGYFEPGKLPDVLSIDRLSLEVVPNLQRFGGRGERDNLMTVAWAANENRIYAGGNLGFSNRRVPIISFDLTNRRSEAIEAGATSTITDMQVLPDGRLAFATANGSWGIAPTGANPAIHASQIPDLTGPSNLRISSDARRISWTLEGGAKRVQFDFDKRVLNPSSSDGLAPPLLRRASSESPSNWENQTEPVVNGKRISLPADELSRAVTLSPSSQDAILGTSRALYRIAGDGSIIWRLPTQTEVRAVNISGNGKLVVTAMLDGTVRVRRLQDGQELLSIFAVGDGRWVIWSPSGYYDAGPGAEGIVGWLINGAGGESAEFYSIGRLRERFHRPDIIDRVLVELDERAAIAFGASERLAAASQSVREASAEVRSNPSIASSAPVQVTPVAKPASTPTEPSPAPVVAVEQALPPLLAYRQSPAIVVGTSTTTAKLYFDVSVRQGGALSSVVVRRDGVAQPASVPGLPQLKDGKGTMSIEVAVPPGESIVHVAAANANGYSDALTFSIRRELPLPPPAPAASEERSPKPVPKQPGSSPEKPRLFVLAIGVAKYVEPKFNTLKYSAKDAVDFAATLERQRGRVYQDVTTKVLTDRNASKDAILKGLDWLVANVGPNDYGLLFLSGHGLNHTDGSYYFLSNDFDYNRVPDTAVSEARIRSALVGLKGRALFFVDTCHSGYAVGTLLPSARDVSKIANELASPENGVIVFTSSTGRQESYEREDWLNGAFTKSLVSGLIGGADFLKRNTVTFQGLGFFVSSEVSKLTGGLQTPVLIVPPPGFADFPVAYLRDVALHESDRRWYAKSSATDGSTTRLAGVDKQRYASGLPAP